ncbi:MAG: hypothetical protein IH612_02600 [Desulfofustis sp.]|nr:hypothetical protein [Desulfofustis sp.]
MYRFLAILAFSLFLSLFPTAAKTSQAETASASTNRSIIIINEKTASAKPGMMKGVVQSIGPHVIIVKGENGKIYRVGNKGNIRLNIGDFVAYVEVDPVGGKQ